MANVITQIYTPVKHSNGELLVQVTNPDGAFCGWADGRGKFDLQGTWEISDKWLPEQAAQFAHSIKILKENCAVTITEDGVSRIVTSTI